MEDKRKFILSMLCAAILVFFLYVLFHELGHTLVAIACGAKITNFSIMKAHMSYFGGNFNQTTNSLFHASGMLLPVLVCLVNTLTFNRNKSKAFYIGYSVIFFIMTASSVLAWIIVPIVSIFSTPPTSDDVTKFLISSQWNPLIIILIATSLIAMLVIIALYKGIFKSLIDLRNKMQKQEIGKI